MTAVFRDFEFNVRLFRKGTPARLMGLLKHRDSYPSTPQGSIAVKYSGRGCKSFAAYIHPLTDVSGCKKECTRAKKYSGKSRQASERHEADSSSCGVFLSFSEQNAL